MSQVTNLAFFRAQVSRLALAFFGRWTRCSKLLRSSGRHKSNGVAGMIGLRLPSWPIGAIRNGAKQL